MPKQPPVGQVLLIVEASRSHSGTPHSVGFPWTSDQPDADLYLTIHNTQKRQTSMPQAGFEPAVPASERPQTDALGRAATGICPALGNSPQRSTGNARPGRKMGLRFKRGEPPTASTRSLLPLSSLWRVRLERLPKCAYQFCH